MKILTVDDNATNRYLLQALLSAHGHAVDSAEDGLQALDLIRHHPYDLIISDILMPSMDGFQLCHEVKSDPELRRIPFVFYTATYTDDRDRRFALDLGADSFIIKPQEPEEFVREIDRVIAECGSRPSRSAESERAEEAVYLKQYNARLVAKLEKKMLDLEATNRALQADIAARERAEADRALLEVELRQAQKLEALGTFASGIAHDFNNLLTAIRGNVRLAIADLPKEAPAHASLDEISRASERGADLVQRILAFGRRAEPDRKVVAPQPIVEEALALLRPSLPANVQIRIEFAADLPLVRADPSQIHQVVVNLVGNARDAMSGRGGVITVRLASVTADERLCRLSPELHAGQYLRLSVVDEGRGMDAATLERLYEPFFSTKPQGQGSGLGLWVVRGIARSHEGTVLASSRVGIGTTFDLYLPAVVTAGQEAQVGAEVLAPPCGAGENILFVDDDDALVFLARRTLERMGYVVTGMTDTAPALAAFQADPNAYALVITDLNMPGMNGTEFARELLRRRPDLPVILTSGYVRPEEAKLARQIGVRDIVLKPNTVAEMGAILRTYLHAAG